MKLKEWLQIWLENYVKPMVKERTYINYASNIERHILPNIGEFDLNEVTPINLQTFVSQKVRTGHKLSKDGLAESTVNTIITLLKNSFKVAFALGYVKSLPTEYIKRPKCDVKKVECFNLNEQKKIEKYVLESNKTKLFGIILALYTGLRIGELLALEWNDIDLKKGMITVSKTCYDSSKGVVVDTPKTKSSCRIIPIPKQLIPLLKELKKTGSVFVVSNKGKSVGVRSYQRTFELLLKKLKISHKGFHALRHTFATRALECGMDIKTLSEILGHKNPMITVSRYAHSLLEHKSEMMNKLGRLLK